MAKTCRCAGAPRRSTARFHALQQSAEPAEERKLIPAAERGSRRLMVMLHGLGDSIEGYRWLPEALRLPWLNYLLVNAPDDYYGGFSWYNITGDHAPGVLRSRQLLFGLLDDLRARGYLTEQTTRNARAVFGLGR